MFSRSGLGRLGLVVAQGVGVIDSDYRGEIKVGLVNLSGKAYTIEPGERIAQLVITPVTQANIQLVDELDNTDRGGRRIWVYWQIRSTEHGHYLSVPVPPAEGAAGADGDYGFQGNPGPGEELATRTLTADQLVEELSRPLVEAVVEDILQSGMLELCFECLEKK